MKNFIRKNLVQFISTLYQPLILLMSRWFYTGGYIHREAWYKKQLKKSGTPLWFHSKVKLICPQKIEIGDYCTFESFVVLESSPFAKGIYIGSNVRVRTGTVLNTGNEPSGSIKIGDSTLINYNCSFLGNGGIEIGKNVLISPGVVLTSFQHGFKDTSCAMIEQSPKLKEIVIENDVYLGSNVVVCPGVKIGKGSVVGAGAVVIKNIPDYSIAVGVPAKVIKSRKDDN